MNQETREKLLKSICQETMSQITIQPYKFLNKGVAYEVATDGILFLAMRAEASELPMMEKKYSAIVAGWLAQPVTHEADTKSLLGFLRVDDCLKCPACAGSGQRVPRAEDELFEPECYDPFMGHRWVKLGDATISGNLLIRCLSFLPMPERLKICMPEITHSETPPRQLPVVILGAGWGVGIMPGLVKPEPPEAFELQRIL